MLWYTVPAPDWFEALPLGNGRLGAKVFGRVESERIALNLDELWSGDGPSALGVTDGPAVLAEIRRLLLVDGDRLAASSKARSMQGPLVESYQPLGDLEITDLVSEHSFTDYERRLDLADGIVSVRYARGGVKFDRETYVSAPDQLLVCTIRADTPGAINTRLGLVSQHPAAHEPLDGSTVTMRGHAPSDLTIEYRESPDPIRYAEGRGIGFGVALRVYVDGGTVTTGPDGITVRNATSLTAVLAGATTFESWDVKPGADPAVAVAEAVATLAAVDLEGLRDRHLADHREMFSRVELALETPDELTVLPTDERIGWVGAGGNDPGLAALAFDFGRYLLMASSRPGTQAANLQGIWNEDRRPMWASDWTNNINTQMNYWAAEVVGLSDCAEPLFDNIVALATAGAATARDLYGAPGWVSHHNADIWMATWPVGAGGDDPVWSMAPSCGIWLSAHLMDHYRFSLDRDFLRDKAYPVLKGAAEFALAMLVEDSRGQLQIVPSTSPEHHFYVPTGEKASVDITTTYDIWLFRELFANVLEATEIVDGDADLAKRIREVRLPQIPIGADGRIMEWSTDWPPSERHHRHHSQLYGLHPGVEITAATPEWMAAARATIAVRAELGTPAGGWTHAWYVAFWARLLEGDNAGRVVREYLGRLVSDNLLHRDGDIFQIDANFGITAAIAEMLLQSHTGEIHLLPALPRDWPTGSVRGLRARGGLTIDLEWRDNRLTNAQVTADHDGHYVLLYNNTRTEVDLTAGQTELVRPGV